MSLAISFLTTAIACVKRPEYSLCFLYIYDIPYSKRESGVDHFHSPRFSSDGTIALNELENGKGRGYARLSVNKLIQSPAPRG